MIFVQADPPDEPAVALYRKLGVESRRQAVIKGERLRLL